MLQSSPRHDGCMWIILLVIIIYSYNRTVSCTYNATHNSHVLRSHLACSNKWPGGGVVTVASKFGASILLVAIIKATRFAP